MKYYEIPVIYLKIHKMLVDKTDLDGYLSQERLYYLLSNVRINKEFVKQVVNDMIKYGLLARVTKQTLQVLQRNRFKWFSSKNILFRKHESRGAVGS